MKQMILFSLFIFLVKIELAQSITQSICATTECPDIKINIKESSDAGAGNGIATTMTLEFIPDLTAPGLFKPLNQTGQSQGDICMLDPDEQCVGSLYNRKLLRFATETWNIGDADYFVGATPLPPPDGQSNDIFRWSNCHYHYHYRNYVEYKLYDINCNEVNILANGKMGFCATNSGRLPGYTNDPVPPGYNCIHYSDNNNYQGITWGHFDVYDKAWPCQFLDLTDISDGKYFFRATLNPERKIEEGNATGNPYENNRAYVLFDMQGTNLTVLYADHTIPDNLILNNTGNLTESKVARQNIEAGNNITVQSSSRVEFLAGNEIILKDGFTALQGSDFHAGIICMNQSFKNNDGNFSAQSVNDFKESILEISPNPSVSTYRFEYTIADKSTINLTIHNLYGQTLSQPIYNQLQEEGKHYLVIDNADLPPAIYFCTFSASNEKGEIFKETKKLVKLR